ncbi:MAG TPA: class I SAM-dependent methyltransferase [Arthrobacter bacterium]|nr:class I SAM-dependent methyltransferase [Arthrobacter sp.]
MEEPGSDQRLAEFIVRLKSESRHNVLEVGSGIGLDGLQFVRAGIHYTGVDQSEEHVQQARAKGLNVSVASAQQLPFADGIFPAVWTMTTLVHVPATDIDGVLRELVRVTAPGAPIAVGLWSGEDDEVLNPEDDVEPRRFFSRRSDATVRQVFGRHGAIEDFVTWPEGTGAESGPGAGNWTQHYQFLILRTPSSPK